MHQSYPTVGRDKAATNSVFISLLLSVVNDGDVREVDDIVKVVYKINRRLSPNKLKLNLFYII